ncbi:hypothetical protein [Caenispirillum bisanense]|uniref:Uncharacterized protein n=1 Tax=Caenispirillum bisanense TaxID=414052 RepID=A0A286GI80_9PROT|nr:hypothetical protein [Caenispirillum bisanense]SOD95245.1 hypothetical protein SAMN05421508_104274 [Caenispirillum bisanense]
MTYAAMTFFILAVMSALFGFTTFESGAEPTAAALARLLAVVFGIGFLVAAVSLALRRAAERQAGGADDGAVVTRDGPARLGTGLTASERGSWDGARRPRPAERPDRRDRG